MMKDLKAIRDNTPEDGKAEYVDDERDYWRMNTMCDFELFNREGKWVECEPQGKLRLLSDIERIIELEEWKTKAEENYKSMMGAYLND